MNNIYKAVFFKEWIKTKIVFILFSLLSLVALIYNLAIWYRIATFKGESHLWEIVIGKDTLLIQSYQYLPYLMAIAMAIFQFLPEMRERRLKLTLHLPIGHNKMAAMMVLSGVTLFVAYSIVMLCIALLASNYYFPFEITERLITTFVTWHLGALTTYLLASRIVLEGTRRYAITHLLVSVLIVSLFFQSSTPGAYAKFLPFIALMCVASSGWILFSIDRFKRGERD
ncbi:MAG: hypothetical protein ACRC6R_01150 [Bacteroidales bacterium]